MRARLVSPLPLRRALASALIALSAAACAAEPEEDVVVGDESLVTQEELELGAGLPEADFRGPLPASAPESDLRRFDTPAKAQGGRGWCTAFATIAGIENLAKQKLGITGDLSEIDHYQSYRQYAMLASVKTAAKVPIAPESAWPYYGSPVADYKAQRIAKVVSYAAPESREEVLAELAAGHPLVIGITTYNNFSGGADGRIPMPGWRRSGGHAMSVVGFRRDASYDGGGYLVVKNSWGPTFGERGYGKLPLGYCRVSSCYFLALRSIAWGGATTGDTGAPPTPVEPPEPPPPSAPSGEVIDDRTVQTVARHDASNGARFRLALTTTPAILGQIASVRYDVDASFGAGRYATSSDRASSFQTTTVYKTYDHDWRTNSTELTLVDGRKVVIAGAPIRW